MESFATLTAVAAPMPLTNAAERLKKKRLLLREDVDKLIATAEASDRLK
jgi:hypothetical protein